jgi:hypothetical protein
LLSLPDSADSDSWEVFGSNTNFRVSKAYKNFVGPCYQEALENMLSL